MFGPKSPKATITFRISYAIETQFQAKGLPHKTKTIIPTGAIADALIERFRLVIV